MVHEAALEVKMKPTLDIVRDNSPGRRIEYSRAFPGWPSWGQALWDRPQPTPY